MTKTGTKLQRAIEEMKAILRCEHEWKEQPPPTPEMIARHCSKCGATAYFTRGEPHGHWTQ